MSFLIARNAKRCHWTSLPPSFYTKQSAMVMSQDPAIVSQHPPGHYEGWILSGQESIFLLSLTTITTIGVSVLVGKLLVGRYKKIALIYV
jgi:hypothetical protein